MERRKLQKVGGGTYTVSVPKEWAESQSLSAGSTMHLYDHVDGSLVVRTERSDGGGLTEARVEIESHDSAVVRTELAGAHAAGFDTVVVEAGESFTERQRDAVAAATRELVGMEITEESETAITVRNLLDASEFSVRQSVVRLQFVSLSALRRATAALVETNGGVEADGVEADGDVIEGLRDRAAEADRLCDVIARSFDRSLSSFEELDRLGVTRSELFDYYATADELGDIVDRSVDLARAAASLPGRPPEESTAEVRELSGTVRRVAEDAVTAALADDRTAARDVLGRCDAAAGAIERLDRQLSGDGAMRDRPPNRSTLRRALDSLARIVDRVTDIAAVAVRSARRTGTESTPD